MNDDEYNKTVQLLVRLMLLEREQMDIQPDTKQRIFDRSITNLQKGFSEHD